MAEPGPAGRDDPDPLVRRARPTTSRVYEPVWAAVRRAGPGPAHPLRRRARRLRARPGLHGHLRHRGVLVGGPSALGPALGRRVRAPSRACATSIAENGAWWVPDLVAQDGREVGRRPQHPEVRRRLPRADLDEAERVPRPQLLLRRVDARASRTSAAATTSASATCCGATTSRTPRAPSPTPASWSGGASRTCPATSAARILGHNAAELYGIDTAALAPLVERIGPLVEDIHGDDPATGGPRGP